MIGFSCIGQETVGTVAILRARADKDVIWFTDDGRYMMANTELAAAMKRRVPFIPVPADTDGFVADTAAMGAHAEKAGQPTMIAPRRTSWNRAVRPMRALSRAETGRRNMAADSHSASAAGSSSHGLAAMSPARPTATASEAT